MRAPLITTKSTLICLLTMFTTFSFSQNYGWKVLYTSGEAQVLKGNSWSKVTNGFKIYKGNKLRVSGSLVLMTNDGKLFELNKGEYQCSRLEQNGLVSPENMHWGSKYGYMLEREIDAGLKESFSSKYDAYFSSYESVNWQSCSNEINMYPFVPREYGIGYVTGPRLFLNVSRQSRNPKVQIYTMYGEMIYERNLNPGLIGELDLGDVNQNIEMKEGEDYILNFKSDGCESGVQFAFRIPSDTLSNTVRDLNSVRGQCQKPYDYVIYACMLYEQGFYMEAVNAMVQAKLKLNRTERTLIDVVLNNWVFANHGSVMREPIIYLYGAQDSVEIDVKLNGEMTFSYPEYNNGWRVKSSTEGPIYNYTDSTTYRYLFWEGELNYSLNKTDSKKGFVVAKDETVAFLKESLYDLGLSNLEVNDFIVFWGPILQRNEFNYIHFKVDELCDPLAEMDVLPKPEAIRRVYMLFEPCEESREVTPQTLEGFERSGFTVVEWGGMELPSLRVSTR